MRGGLGWTNTQSWAGQRKACSPGLHQIGDGTQDNICHECAMHTKHTHSICCAHYTLHGTHTQHTEYARTRHMLSVQIQNMQCTCNITQHRCGMHCTYLPLCPHLLVSHAEHCLFPCICPMPTDMPALSSQCHSWLFPECQ